jgi:hypothetical protein
MSGSGRNHRKIKIESDAREGTSELLTHLLTTGEWQAHSLVGWRKQASQFQNTEATLM